MYDSMAEEIISLISTPGTVKEWLLAKHPNDIVGQTNLSDTCLLAYFLGEFGFSVSIGNFFDLSTFSIKGSEKLRDLPDFAMLYAERLDSETIYYLSENLNIDEDLLDLYPNYPSVPISGSIALNILRDLETDLFTEGVEQHSL